MLKVTLRVLIGCSMAVLAATPSLAAWTVTRNPDNSVVLLGEADEGRFIQFWCRGDSRQIAVLVNDGRNDVPTGTAQLEFAADTGSTWRSDGVFFRYSDGWLGLDYERTADMPAIVDDIIGAQGNIGAAVILPDETIWRPAKTGSLCAAAP